MRKLQNLINNLRQLNQDIQDFGIEINPDNDGYIDLECPKQECLFEFKIHADDVDDIFHRESVYCPRCNTNTKGDQFYPSAFMEQVREDLISKFREALFDGRRLPKRLEPFDAKETWKQKIKCEECEIRYSVVGAAFFCPACGHNSVERIFTDSINKIQLKARATPNKALALSEGLTEDDIENLLGSLRESCLSDCVTSFEYFSNHYYLKKTGNKAKRNVFQRVLEGSNVWKSVIGKGYHDWIPDTSMDIMNKLFQQRHLFIHNQGIVDQEYLDKSLDNSYKLKQRIVVNTDEIVDLTEILLILSDNLKTYCV